MADTIAAVRELIGLLEAELVRVHAAAIVSRAAADRALSAAQAAADRLVIERDSLLERLNGG